jgi:hypothetical protein
LAAGAGVHLTDIRHQLASLHPVVSENAHKAIDQLVIMSRSHIAQ